MPVNDLWELRVYTQFTDQMAVNVNHYSVQSSTGVGTLSPNNVANQFSLTIATLYKACLVADCQMYGISATKILPILGQTGTSVAGQGPGTFGTDAGPRQVSGIITKRTVVGGRKGRGRVYVPFPSADASDAATGRPTTDYVTALSALAGGFQTNFSVTTGGITEVLWWSLYHKGAIAPFDLVTTAIPRGKWATQRRRGDYGRPNVTPF